MSSAGNRRSHVIPLDHNIAGQPSEPNPAQIWHRRPSTVRKRAITVDSPNVPAFISPHLAAQLVLRHDGYQIKYRAGHLPGVLVVSW
jgi:hypothetical protein